MSDFLSELRGDLVDAHERYGRRSRTGRVVRPVHPRTWRPAALLAGVVAAACLIAGVVGIRALRGPTPASLRVVEQIRIGGAPVDAATGFGYLWVANGHTGVVHRVDLAHNTVVRRIPVVGAMDSIAAGGGAVWVTVGAQTQGRARLVRIDPATGRVTATLTVGGSGAQLAAGHGRVWLLGTYDENRWLKSVDPATARSIATIRTRTAGDAIAIGGGSLWTLDSAGVLTQRDANSGRPLRRVPGLGGSSGAGERVLAADASGVWVLRPRSLVRVEGGSIVRRIPLPAGTLPVLAQSGGDLWVVRSVGSQAKSRLLRIDRGTGAVTGSLTLGASHQPQALVPSPRGLWVIGADGTAQLVR